jgi:hypoxanthine phosphoribosyltransferase
MGNTDIWLNLREVNEDIADLVSVVKKVFHSFDVVVGIPRAGMMIASQIAEVYGKPLSSTDMLLEGKYWWRNQEFDFTANHAEYKPVDIKTALIVDDTAASGDHMKKAYRQLKEIHPHIDFKKIALYATPVSEENLDLYCKSISTVHLMETNFAIYGKCTPPYSIAMDMDGVLCEDCPIEVAKDDVKYAKFLKEAKPYLKFLFKINYIVTARLERYRKETEEWLKKNEVNYGKLIMQPDNGNANAGRLGTDHAKWKASILKTLPEGTNFYESSTEQAKRIHELTGIQVLATDNMVMYGQRNPSYHYHPAFEGIKKRMIVDVPIKPIATSTSNEVKNRTWLFK